MSGNISAQSEAKHTAGTLPKLVVERLCDGNGPWHSICIPWNNRLAILADTLNRDHTIDPDEDRANARRFAASWEACKHLSIDELEKMDAARLSLACNAHIPLIEALVGLRNLILDTPAGRHFPPDVDERMDAALAALQLARPAAEGGAK